MARKTSGPVETVPTIKSTRPNVIAHLKSCSMCGRTTVPEKGFRDKDGKLVCSRCYANALRNERKQFFDAFMEPFKRLERKVTNRRKKNGTLADGRLKEFKDRYKRDAKKRKKAKKLHVVTRKPKLI